MSHKCIHPGCAVPYLRKKGTSACCLKAFAIKDDDLILESQAVSSRAFIATKFASVNAHKIKLAKACGLIEDNSVNPSTPLCNAEMFKLPEEVPAWFKDFVQTMHNKIDSNNEAINNKMDATNNKIDAHFKEVSTHLTRLETAVWTGACQRRSDCPLSTRMRFLVYTRN
ncbi:hypothetical protein TKK_0016115 [Trichogramma kaykai]